MSDSFCPLVTDYTNELGISPEVLERLYLVRKWEIDPDHPETNPIPFNWPSLLRTKILNLNTEQEEDELVLRQYQIQVIHHFARMNRFMCGDAVGLKKTCDAIASVCWLKDRIPDLKVLVVTTRSTTWQWFDEIRRFSLLRPFVMVDKYRGLKSYASRHQQIRDFFDGHKKDILIGKYSSMIGARKPTGKFDDNGKPKIESVSKEILEFAKIIKQCGKNVVIVFDEAHRFKTPGSQTRALVIHLSKPARWVWALTGTAMKNNATEFYAAISAIGVRPFGNMWEFGDKFCIFHKQYVGRGQHKRVLDGYQNMDEFKRGLRPFYLGRSQAQVKEPLPKLQTTYHPVDLDDRQTKLLLDEIPNGTFVLPPTLKRIAGEIYEFERDPSNAMTMMSVQQLVANHWGLIDREDKKNFFSPTLSPKEEALLDLLDGDLNGEKVIVFSKFLRHIDRLENLTKAGKFTGRRFLRITGNENDKERNVSKRLFQESADHDLIFINAAGIEGLNLQQAAHMVCLDLPWSWGDLIQLVGRMVRSASPHTSCTLHILIARGTIDEYTVDVLIGKKGVFEAILGSSASAGLLGGEQDLDLDSGMECDTDDEFKLELLRTAHKRKESLRTFLVGDRIEEAKSDPDYALSFERKQNHAAQRHSRTTEGKKPCTSRNQEAWECTED
jgi:SNF2 family DNA or RNA helicase